MPKKIDDILHPTPPEDPRRVVKAHILESLRVAKDAGDALTVTDIVEMKLPEGEKAGFMAKMLLGALLSPTLEGMVEEGTVVKAVSDGVPYYWLADESMTAGDG